MGTCKYWFDRDLLWCLFCTWYITSGRFLACFYLFCVNQPNGSYD